jgi:hypothetical protein
MLTGVTRPFHAPHALFTPSTAGPTSFDALVHLIRLLRSMTRFCARDVTEDITSLPRRACRSGSAVDRRISLTRHNPRSAPSPFDSYR